MWPIPAATDWRANSTFSGVSVRRLVPSPIRATSRSPRVSVFAIMGGLYPAREEGHVPLAGLGEVDADHAVRPRRVPGEAGDVLSAQGGVGIVHLDEVADLLAG